MNRILIVHNYFGPRRVFLKPYEEDSLFLAKKQIQYLEEVKHNLDHIVFTVNRRGTEDDKAISQLRQILPKNFQKATTEILVRENIGLSYGAFPMSMLSTGKITISIFSLKTIIFSAKTGLILL